MNDLSKRLRKYRKDRHLTQNEMCLRIGCSLSTYRSYEIGTCKKPREDFSNRIEELLAVKEW